LYKSGSGLPRLTEEATQKIFVLVYFSLADSKNAGFCKISLFPRFLLKNGDKKFKKSCKI